VHSGVLAEAEAGMATAPAMMVASAAIWSFIFRSFRHLLGLVHLCAGPENGLGNTAPVSQVDVCLRGCCPPRLVQIIQVM
jgi:hypothetical protein